MTHRSREGRAGQRQGVGSHFGPPSSLGASSPSSEVMPIADGRKHATLEPFFALNGRVVSALIAYVSRNELSDNRVWTVKVPSRISQSFNSKRLSPRFTSGSLRMNSAASTSLSVRMIVIPSPTS